MGNHYSDCYDADDRATAMRVNRVYNERLQKFADSAGIDDKEFICDIIENIEKYKGFFAILHQKK